MAKIIAFANQKGGVAKSTSAINMAAVLAQNNKSVLVVDLDPQGNSTVGLGINQEGKETIYDCLLKEASLKNVIQKTRFDGIDVMPSDIMLANAELELASVIGRETVLRERFIEQQLEYDYILIDLPPNLGLLTLNGLAAADKIIVPVDMGIFSLTGINQLIKVINLVKRKLNQNLAIGGVLLTKVDGRTKLGKEMYDDLKEIFNERMFKTVIHQNIKIQEAQKEQIPVVFYDPACRGAKEYTAATEELMKL